MYLDLLKQTSGGKKTWKTFTDAEKVNVLTKESPL